jgi:hypothetical protein
MEREMMANGSLYREFFADDIISKDDKRNIDYYQ